MPRKAFIFIEIAWHPVVVFGLSWFVFMRLAGPIAECCAFCRGTPWGALGQGKPSPYEIGCGSAALCFGKSRR